VSTPVESKTIVFLPCTEVSQSKTLDKLADKFKEPKPRLKLRSSNAAATDCLLAVKSISPAAHQRI